MSPTQSSSGAWVGWRLHLPSAQRSHTYSSGFCFRGTTAVDRPDTRLRVASPRSLRSCSLARPPECFSHLGRHDAGAYRPSPGARSRLLSSVECSRPSSFFSRSAFTCAPSEETPDCCVDRQPAAIQLSAELPLRRRAGRAAALGLGRGEGELRPEHPSFAIPAVCSTAAPSRVYGWPWSIAFFWPGAADVDWPPFAG